MLVAHLWGFFPFSEERRGEEKKKDARKEGREVEAAV